MENSLENNNLRNPIEQFSAPKFTFFDRCCSSKGYIWKQAVDINAPVFGMMLAKSGGNV